MCGITGAIAFTASGAAYTSRCPDAVIALSKRGPDGNGVFEHDNIALGHARLSIIDVSNNAAQPFSDESGRYTLVFNGEFFNFNIYREQLLAEGVRFRSTSDTEVLLHLLIREGEHCLPKVNGFFAFAFWDNDAKTLLLARDRYGVKPLLFSQNADALCFASEMKSLLAYPLRRELDHTSVFHYLHLNYIPGPYSIFEGVQKLEPGHWLKVSNKKVEQGRWYSIPETVHQPIPSYEDAQIELVNKLTAAVERRLIADVPLGSFLSGGIDSSVVTALAAKFRSGMHTFSIGYKDEPLFDETHYAKLVAKQYGTKHTVFSLSNRDLFEHLHEMLEYIDEPFADSSALAVNILCKETRKHATVALSGDGADELFGGYMKHLGEWKLRNGGFKAEVVTMLGPLWNALPKSRNSAYGNLFRKLDKFSKGRKMSAADRYWKWCGYADEHYQSNMPAFAVDAAEVDARKRQLTRFIGKTGDMNEVLLNDLHLVLPGDMLTKVDLMSMARSLEVRSPFLDVEVVDFAAGLPADYKVNGLGRKRIVQDAFRSILPEELYNRPKHGFEVPLLQWFRTDLKSWIFDDLLEPGYLKNQGLFSPEAVRELKQSLFSNDPGDSTARVWALIVFQNWYRRWMK
jgi:asparagine synthase (glutamine-hydrolysing)